MFTISDDSTEEWTRYLLAGSRGWSILKSLAAPKTAPLTSMSPMNNPAHPEPELKDASPGVAKMPSPVVPGENPPVKEPPVPPWMLELAVSSPPVAVIPEPTSAPPVVSIPSQPVGPVSKTVNWAVNAGNVPLVGSPTATWPLDWMVRSCWRKLNAPEGNLV